ncbi:MAG: hypothetical protein ABSD68_02165 [Candidatus Micrarchaeales archaeon]
MEEPTDFAKLVELVDSAGAYSNESTVLIDISEVFGNTLNIRKMKYEDVSQLLEGGEVKKAEVAPEAQPKAQVEAAVPKRPTKKETEKAAEKVRNMAGGKGKEFEKKVNKEIEKAEKKGLVIPRLSLQDQLSDLEKIDEGIAEGVFDKEQTKIILDEVKTISYISSHEDIEKFSEDQKEIVFMRNQKIKEIKDRLHIK